MANTKGKNLVKHNNRICRATLLYGAWLCVVSSCLFCTAVHANNQGSYSHNIELLLNDVFQELRDFKLQSAAGKTAQLTDKYPDFALGQLLHAELMITQGLDKTLIDSEQAFSPRLLELIMEAQSRVRQSTIAVDNTRLPGNLLQIGNDIEHIVTVDLEYSRLYLVKNQDRRPRIVAHHYAGSGRGGYGKLAEGDLRTPTGVYRVTEFKPESALPELYGAGALTLDYPNALDRHYKRTGSGIWLHGIPRDNLSRGPRSSEGCVVMPNDLLVDLSDALDLDSTLVVLSGELGWQTRQALQYDSEEFITLFQQWRRAWLDSDLATLNRLHNNQPLLQHASLSYTPFARQQALMQRLVEVSTDDITIIRYPVFPGDNGSATRSAGLQAADLAADLASTQIMMQFTLPGKAASDVAKTGRGSQKAPAVRSEAGHRITLYWELNANNQWRVVQIKQDPLLI